MTHINSMNIKNFKNIDQLEFKPGKINIITGKNNSGKTSLLQSIYISSFDSQKSEISNQLNGIKYFVKKGEKYSNINTNFVKKKIYDNISEQDPDVRGYLISNLIGVFEENIKNNISFYDKFVIRFDSTIKINNESDITHEKKSEKVRFSSKEVIPYIEDIANIIINNIKFTIIEDEDSFLIIYSEKENRSKWDDIYQKIESSIDIDNFSLKSRLFYNLFNESSPDYIFKNGEKKSSKNNKMIVYLSETDKIPFEPLGIAEIKLLDDFINEYHLIDNFYRLDSSGILYREENGNQYELPFESHGEGFLSLMNIIRNLRKAKDGIILIEELENHLHPGYLDLIIDTVFTLANELNIQVFITTHSYDLIETALDSAGNLELEDDIKILNLRKDDQKSSLREFDFREASRYLNELSLDLRGI